MNNNTLNFSYHVSWKWEGISVHLEFLHFFFKELQSLKKESMK